MPDRPPRYPTPASGVRATTQAGHGQQRNDDTPVESIALAKIGARTKEITTSTSSIDRRVGNLETGQTALAIQVVGLDSKVDVLVEESQHTRREREERERRAEARADKDMDYRRERMLKILVPMVAVLATLATALAAGLAGAFR